MNSCDSAAKYPCRTPDASSSRRKIPNPVRRRGAELAQRFVVEALGVCSASLIARHLGVSPDLVRGWGQGRSALSLGDVLAAPLAFRLRMVTLLGEVEDRGAARQDPAQLLSRSQALLSELVLACVHPPEALSESQLHQAKAIAARLEEAGRALRLRYLAESARRGDVSAKGGGL